MDNEFIKLVVFVLENKELVFIECMIVNVNCFVGVMLFGEFVKCYGYVGLVENIIMVKFKGMVGGSFGVFFVCGICFDFEGDLNDYVGKGLFGG